MKGVGRIRILTMITLMTAGCVSSTTEQINTVMSQYDVIRYEDGIDWTEAQIIAQRELIKRNLVKIYDLAQPREFRDVSDLLHQDKYWFVFFREKKVANIEYIFMAIINRETGTIRFSDDFQEDKRWIIEAAMLGG